MKKLAILTLLALELAVGGCGNTPPTNFINTETNSNWEAQLIGGTGEASKLSFVTQFAVANTAPLTIIQIGFINSNACFQLGQNFVTANGTATLTTASNGAVTGTLTFNALSETTNNALSLTGNLTGTSNGTTGTTGTLSNGVVQGTWALTGGAGDPTCGGQQGTFIMCQGKNTCTAP
jgi:hypothetical protein